MEATQFTIWEQSELEEEIRESTECAGCGNLTLPGHVLQLEDETGRRHYCAYCK